MTKFQKNLFLALFLGFFAVASTFAASALPWDTPLQTVLNYLTSSTARIVGGIAIAVCGLMAMFSEGAFKKIMIVVAGLGVAINAVSLVNTLFGTGSGMLIH
jgi:type IV secretion system protein VirB2